MWSLPCILEDGFPHIHGWGDFANMLLLVNNDRQLLGWNYQPDMTVQFTFCNLPFCSNQASPIISLGATCNNLLIILFPLKVQV